MQNGINKYHINEKTNIENFIYQYLLNKKHINSFFDNYTNKLYNLFVASSVGLKIPSTTITTNKLTIIHEINTHKKMITKAITEGSIRFSPNSGIGYHTCLIENKNLLTMPDNFSRSLIQPCIDKAYELRIFYLDNDFYPMAIFSQNDEQTKIDFRNYNYAKPNRTVPYNLPIEIKDKLIEFVKKIEINSGSIDIVVSKSNDFYFLEVNPIGQFQQLSTPCNYYIEKKIAHYLQ